MSTIRIGEQTAYEAKLVSTEANLRRFVDQVIGVINEHSEGNIPEEAALAEVNSMYHDYAKLLVDDLAPLQRLTQ